MRILLQPAPHRGCRPGRAIGPRSHAPGSLSIPRCCFSVSINWRPMVSTGFREVIGSWNTMPISPPVYFTHLCIRELQDVAAAKANCHRL